MADMNYLKPLKPFFFTFFREFVVQNTLKEAPSIKRPPRKKKFRTYGRQKI